MKNSVKISFVGALLAVAFMGCEPKSPIPEIKNGAHFVALPDPLPTAVTAANVNTIPVPLTGVASASMSFTTKSQNAVEIEKVDAYVSHVRGTVVTPAATTSAPHGVMVKSITTLNGKEQISVSELLTKTGFATANLRANDRIRVRFVATMKDGRVFSWQNSGPGITVNPLGSTFTPLLDVLLQ
ncbi:hypothetical protein [Runella aurantiaca]|uniref:Uncharacterized protein n=1 Tax=Runella aurantiaca TaxID=2282308 RepID=A0A369I615_9BACT|nr:hypothetical protein [Runella aurantiaca]RDB03917.1 hypothetical protein DVG78_21145 [Runella aurantiaca]